MSQKPKVIDDIYLDADELASTISKYHELGYGVDVECRLNKNHTTEKYMKRYRLRVLKIPEW